MSSSLIACNNKGCYQTDYHKLDLDSNNVYCTNCGKVVEVSPYLKKILASTKQVFRKVETSVKYSCPACNKHDTPVLLEHGKNVFDVCCPHCGKVNTHLTSFFAEPLRMNDEVPRFKVKVSSSPEGDIVVRVDGLPFPWETKGQMVPAPASKALTGSASASLADADVKAKRLADQRAAKKLRIEADARRDILATASARAAIVADEESRLKKLAAKKSNVRRAGPVSADEMLKRVGVSVLVDEDEEVETASRPVIKMSKGNKTKKKSSSPKKASVKGPTTAAEMLKRAGARNLAEDDDSEGEELNG